MGIGKEAKRRKERIPEVGRDGAFNNLKCGREIQDNLEKKGWKEPVEIASISIAVKIKKPEGGD